VLGIWIGSLEGLFDSLFIYDHVWKTKRTYGRGVSSTGSFPLQSSYHLFEFKMHIHTGVEAYR
jgi:hypothetical protein